MIHFIRKSSGIAFGIITAIFTFVPEAFFEKGEWITKHVFHQSELLASLDTQDVNIIISRLVSFFVVWIVTVLSYLCFFKLENGLQSKGRIIRLESSMEIY